jgi:hypothetical protein
MKWVILDPGLVSLVESHNHLNSSELSQPTTASNAADMPASSTWVPGTIGIEAIRFGWSEHSISKLSQEHGQQTKAIR